MFLILVSSEMLLKYFKLVPEMAVKMSSIECIGNESVAESLTSEQI